MAENSNLDHDSPAVQKHLDILQAIIQRMAENSRSCKLWCITLVSATLVLVARTGEPLYTLIVIVPILSLWALDAYYLGLERDFRGSYKTFVEKLHCSKVCVADLYKVSLETGMRADFRRSRRAFGSSSELLFYPAVAITVALVCLFIWLLIKE